MAMQYAGNIIAIINSHKLTTEWISVAMLDEDLFANGFGCTEIIHGDIFAVEGKARKGHTLHIFALLGLDGRRIEDDISRLLVCLFGIIELNTRRVVADSVIINGLFVSVIANTDPTGDSV
ncbi:hypothetical protein MASR1M31_15300 [Porphyromonadaceae bacterium]